MNTFYKATLVPVLLMVILLVSITIEHAYAGDIFFEPSFGGWYGDTRQASWFGGYGELSIWKGINSETGTWHSGLDTLASDNNGNMKHGGYRWNEMVVGTGPALQYFSAEKQNKSWQWQGKALIEFEQIDGDNHNVSYSMTQRSVLAYLYTEYLKRESPDWFWGVLADGRVKLTDHIDSTPHGAQPNNRNAASLSGLMQYKINDTIQGRMTATGFYQAWDRKFGIGISPELRICEKYMLGVRAAEIAGELSLTGYIRIEFGKFPK